MDFVKPRGLFIILGLVTLAFVVVGTVYRAHLWESPKERAHRLCDGCGLSWAELENLIDDIRGPSFRDTKLRHSRAAFDDPEQAEPWESCGEAQVDAADAGD